MSATEIFAMIGIATLILLLYYFIRCLADLYIETKDLPRVIDNKLASHREMQLMLIENLRDRLNDEIETGNKRDSAIHQKLKELSIRVENRDDIIRTLNKELNEEKIKTNTMKHDMHTIFEELGQMRQIYDRNRTTKFLYSEAVREAKKATRKKAKRKA